MATQLSPSEQVAQAMLLLHSKSPANALKALSTMSDAAANVAENDPDATDEDIGKATQAAIQNLGYATDLDSLSSQFDYLVSSHAGFWSGNYTLVDSLGGVHSLLINETDTRLLLDGADEVFKVPSEGPAFSAKTLTVNNDKVSVVLGFSTTSDGVDVTAADTDIADLVKRHKVQVLGSMTVKADNSVRTIHGVRGVSTPAGVYHEFGEEPAYIWAGDYRLRYTDTPTWDFHPDLLSITADPDTHALSVKLGKLQATNVTYSNSAIFCQLELTRNVQTQVSMEMHTTSRGTSMCFVWFETTGQMRTLTGYAVAPVDKDRLWNGVPKAATNAGVRAKAAFATKSATLLGGSQVNFFSTTFDATFSIASLAPAAAADQKDAKDFFTGDSIIAVVNGNDTTVTGFLAREMDEGGMPASERVALFTYSTDTSDTIATVNGNKLPKGARLLAYQQLDEGRHWQFGLEKTQVGVLAPDEFEMPEAVETEAYEVRVSLLDHAKVGANGLRVDFAIDDSFQKTLLSIDQPRAYDSTKDAFNWNAYTGPSAETVAAVKDFTKASVLARISAGETQVTGHKTYYLSLRPRNASGVAQAGFFKATRTIYRPTAGNPDKYEQVGTPVTVAVPILLRFPLQITSVSEIQLTNTVWIPAVRGKAYSARVQILQGGKQPFVWGLLNGADDYTPPGLSWDKIGDQQVGRGVDIVGDGHMVSLGLSGTVSWDAVPGNVYAPLIRVRSDKSVVMNVTKANPQILLSEPETQYRTVNEVITPIIASLLSVGSFVIAILTLKWFKKDVKANLNEQKKNVDAVKQVAVEIIPVDKKLDDVGDFELDNLKDKDTRSRVDKAITFSEDSESDLLEAIENDKKEIIIIDKSDAPDKKEKIDDLKEKIEKEKSLVDDDAKKGNKDVTHVDASDDLVNSKKEKK